MSDAHLQAPQDIHPPPSSPKYNTRRARRSILLARAFPPPSSLTVSAKAAAKDARSMMRVTSRDFVPHGHAVHFPYSATPDPFQRHRPSRQLFVSRSIHGHPSQQQVGENRGPFDLALFRFGTHILARISHFSRSFCDPSPVDSRSHLHEPQRAADSRLTYPGWRAKARVGI